MDADKLLFWVSQALDPGAAADQNASYDTFDQIHTVADGIDRQKRQICETAQQKSQRQIQNPDRTAIEQSGYDGFTAGAKGEINREAVCLQGHQHRRNQNGSGSQQLHLGSGVIKHWERPGQTNGNDTEDNAGKCAQGCHFSVGIHQFFGRAAGAQHLSHKDTHGVAQRTEYHRR